MLDWDDKTTDSNACDHAADDDDDDWFSFSIRSSTDPRYEKDVKPQFVLSRYKMCIR